MSLKISQGEVVTFDDRTAGDVLIYASELLTDGTGANDCMAKDIAESVNHQEMIAAGIVPESGAVVRPTGPDTVVIPSETKLYGATPNPVLIATTIRYDLAVGLTVFNVHGRKVAAIVDSWQPGGTARGKG